MTSALAFNVVKVVGAAYLIYLGVRALIEKPSDPSLPSVSPVTPLKAYLQAIPAEVLNPKTALFFLAFMPQFVHPERGSTFVQFAVLGLIFVVLSSLYTTLIACSIRPLGRLVKRLTWLTRWQGKIIGSIFIALGLRVAVQQRHAQPHDVCRRAAGEALYTDPRLVALYDLFNAGGTSRSTPA